PARARPAARTTPSDSFPLHTQRAARSPAAAPALLPPHSTAARRTPAARPAPPARSAPAGNGPTAAPCSPARTSRGCTRASPLTRSQSQPVRASDRTSKSRSPTPAPASPRRPIRPVAAARSAIPASPETAAYNSDLAPVAVAPPASQTALPDVHKLLNKPHARAVATRARATRRRLPSAAPVCSQRTRSVLRLPLASGSLLDYPPPHPIAGCSAPVITATPPADS